MRDDAKQKVSRRQLGAVLVCLACQADYSLLT